MDPSQFIARWRNTTLKERQGSQSHFNELCDLLEVEKPHDPDSYTFEKSTLKLGGASGAADVWKRGCFAWEYKGDFQNLVRAYAQLKQYADGLDNPPLLIVSDMQTIRIHKNFTNAVSEVWEIPLADLNDPKVRRELSYAWTDPERLRPQKTREAVTAEAAAKLGELAKRLREERKLDPQQVAHFLNRLVFCMFAEDIDLLPNNIFADIVEEAAKSPGDFPDMLAGLFRAMRTGGFYGKQRVPHFNGGLFDDDTVIPLHWNDIQKLALISRLGWDSIDPSIFGTLFEKGLDPAKRAQMAGFLAAAATIEGIEAKPVRKGRAKVPDAGVGIHYTDAAKIKLIIEPVILTPLRAEWEAVKADLAKFQAKADKAKDQAQRTKAVNARRDLYTQFRERLAHVTVLDPACGSGNFLYAALIALKDFDEAVATEATTKLGLPRAKQAVGPAAVRGIEVNPYAAELARVTVWIGELQWQLRNGYKIDRAPILGTLDGIENRDALIDAKGRAAKWPDAESIVGNPPFLGRAKLKSNLGEAYMARLGELYGDRVPGAADLVCYWFAKAWDAIASGHARRVGLASTQAIRQGANRTVLDRIAREGVFFDAWSNEAWNIDGAAVRVSLACFAKQHPGPCRLDGKTVAAIHANLDAGEANVTAARRLKENAGICFQGPVKVGAFDIEGDLARRWLKLPANPNGRGNADVLKPWVNGQGVTGRPADIWLIDFAEMSEAEAAFYEAPFEYVREFVKPERDKNNRPRRKEKYWQHGETVPGLRAATKGLPRFIVTVRVAKHRLFKWVHGATMPDSRLYAFACDDDAMFGVLHSRIHEVWSLHNSSWHGVGNDPTYNNLTCFETFPFPNGMEPARTSSARLNVKGAAAIAEAARALDGARERWLNPPELTERRPEVLPQFPDRIVPRNNGEGTAGMRAVEQLKNLTLTKLYNARPAWLDNFHRALDDAVAAAYGWPANLSDDDILSRLLELNLERAQAQGDPE